MVAPNLDLLGPGRNAPLALVHCTPLDHGTFYTFTSRRNSHDLVDATRILSSTESRRAAEWVGMIRESSSGWSWFDGFVSCATTRIGSESTVDRAIDFTLESYASFRCDWNPSSDRAAQKAGVTAMMALRRELEATPDFDKTKVVLTGGLLCVAEVSGSPAFFTTSNDQ